MAVVALDWITISPHSKTVVPITQYYPESQTDFVTCSLDKLNSDTLQKTPFW